MGDNQLENIKKHIILLTKDDPILQDFLLDIFEKEYNTNRFIGFKDFYFKKISEYLNLD